MTRPRTVAPKTTANRMSASSQLLRRKNTGSHPAFSATLLRASLRSGVASQIRRRRPGVTAAATTAVFATGAGPGVTALATTAVFATGCPMKPTRPQRPGPSGISVSFCRGRVIGLDGGDDRLDRDPPCGDQLATRAACGRCKRRCPQVLPDEHAGGASGVQCGGEVLDVLLCKELRQLSLHSLKWPQLLDVRELHCIDGPVLVLREDQDVDDSDRSGVDQRE